MKSQILEDIDQSQAAEHLETLNSGNKTADAGAIHRPPSVEPAPVAPQPRIDPDMRTWATERHFKARAAAAERADNGARDKVPGPGMDARDDPAGAGMHTEVPQAGAGMHTADPLAGADAEADWLGEQLLAGPTWFDRWGRRAITWSAGLAATVLVAGSGLWLYKESKVDNTLAMLAANARTETQASTSPPVPAPQPPPVASAPLADAATGTAPDPATAASLLADAQAPLAVPALNPSLITEALASEETPVRAAPPVLASASPSKKTRMFSQRPRARAPTPPPVAAAESKSRRAGQFAETLRQCRALGYHATQCMKRGCTITKFGLACKG